MRNGTYKIYYDMNGKLQEESNYKMGKKDGKATWFTTEGKLIAEYVYKNGDLDGPQIAYYGNGTTKQIEEFYVKGKHLGDYKEFYENGNIKLQGQYVNDLKDGKWVENDETGKLIKTTTFKAGVEK